MDDRGPRGQRRSDIDGPILFLVGHVEAEEELRPPRIARCRLEWLERGVERSGRERARAEIGRSDERLVLHRVRAQERCARVESVEAAPSWLDRERVTAPLRKVASPDAQRVHACESLDSPVQGETGI